MHQILKAHIERKSFDHGYLLCGDGELCKKMAFETAAVILSHKGNLGAHPDFLYQKFESFGIDDSRILKEWASSRPFCGNGKVAIMDIFSLSVESANALLKTFEEPNEGIYFFVISPSPETIIPTLRSRLTIIDNFSAQEETKEETIELCKIFLNSLPSRRLESIKKVLTDKIKAVEFLNGLEITLEKTAKTSVRERVTEALEEVQKSREFIFDRASSFKMIMEHLALTLPRL